MSTAASIKLNRTPHTNYRPDIDGLRAIAVLAVLVYHGFPLWAPGGFAGVDVFFVISGYLITSVILNDLERGVFSLPGFYARRVRRIFPALVVVLAAVIFFAWFALLESQFRYIGKHIAAGATFSSNVFLWKETGYFDLQADHKPLLHLWSLAIEEQFYLLWPILVYLAWKMRANLAWLMLLAIVVSFTVNVSKAGHASAFFLPPARAWELAAGGLLSVLHTRHPRRAILNGRGIIQPLIASAGICCVMAAFFLLDSDHPYPGVRALLPAAGTLFIIAAGPDSWLNRSVLSNRLLVACGLISYPLYLWNWPLLSLSSMMRQDTTGGLERAGILVASAMLAYLTYRFVEQPLRFGGRLVLKSILLCVLMAVTGFAGWAAAHGKIVARSLSYGSGKIDAARTDWDFPGHAFAPFTFEGMRFYQTSPGRLTEATGPGQAVFYFGDSQMEQFAPRVARIVASAPAKYPRAVFAVRPGCSPMPKIRALKPLRTCVEFAEKAIAFANSPAVSTVVIDAAWEWYLRTGDFYNSGTGDSYENLEQMLDGFHRAGKRVYLILSIPAGNPMAPESMINRRFDIIHWRFDFRIAGNFMRTADFDFRGSLNARLRAAAQHAGANIIDPLDVLCSAGVCPSAQENGEPRYADKGHLRASFVREHATFMDQTLTDGLSP